MISGITFMSVVVVVLMSVFIVASLIAKLLSKRKDIDWKKVQNVYSKINGRWVKVYTKGDDL